MSPKAAQCLDAARRLIEDEDKWCQGRAIDAEGRICLSQAIALTSPEAERAEILAQIKERSGKPAYSFNDKSTHAEVIELVESLISEGLEGTFETKSGDAPARRA